MLRFALLGLLLATGARAQTSDSLGVLSLSLNIYPAHIVFNENYDEAIEVEGPTFHTLPAGNHTIRVVLRSSRSVLTPAPIAAGDTLRYNLLLEQLATQRPHPAYVRVLLRRNTFVVTEPENTVYVDGEPVGTGSQLLVLPDEARVQVAGAHGRAWQQTVRQDTSGSIVVAQAYLRPERTRASLLRLAPGLHQYYTRKSPYGLAMAGATVLSGGAALWFDHHARTDDRRYERLAYQYRASQTEAEFVERRPGVEAAYDDARRSARLRNVAVGALGTVLALHTLDVVLRPYKGPYRTEIQIRSTLNPDSPSFGVITTF